MPRSSQFQLPILFRPYTLSSLFPVLSFFGENWLVTMKEPEFLHFHNCFEIGYCINGNGRLCFNNYELPFSAGQYSIISPLEPHITICEDTPSRWEYIFFDPIILFGSINSTVTSLCHSYYLFEKPSCIISETSASLWQKLHSLFTEFHEKPVLYPHAMHSLFLSILIELDRVPAQSARPDAAVPLMPIRSALLHIYSHYMEPLTVPELAALCCMSESHFRRIFKNLIGLGPQEYLKHYRIQHACHQLLNSSDAIHQVAHSVGFQSVSSFNRQFAQYTSMTPGEWKKRYETSPVTRNITSLDDDNTLHIFRY